MSEYAVTVDHVWKRFHKGEFHDSLRDAVPAFFRNLFGRGTKATELGKGDFWALKDVNFQVKHGETLGIIGHNGAGKSTLLKILSNIIKPNRGGMQVNGRLRALIEVAAGFHGDLTGRENIYLNGAILGMTQKEITAKFDEIVDFSGIEEFLDTPVKRYSSGMYARLGFAVAAHLEPEILIVDEVLSVGDAAFQKKCLGKMSDVAAEGRTVLFVSHNMAAVKNLCTRSILLDHGEITAEGPTDEVLNTYMGAYVQEVGIPLAQRTDRRGDGRLRFTGVRLESNGKPIGELLTVGSQLSVHLDYACYEKVAAPSFHLDFIDPSGEHLFYINTKIHDQIVKPISRSGSFVFHVERFPLVPGKYTLDIAANSAAVTADYVLQAHAMEVLPGKLGNALVPENHVGRCITDFSWEVTE